MKKNIIVAVADNGAIGKDNSLLWHIPEDLKYFKKVTFGSPVIMGRRTFESIGRPLPGRTNIVVTRGGRMKAADGSGVPFPDGVLAAGSLEEAFAMASMPAVINMAEPCLKMSCDGQPSEASCFVIGGGEIYRQAMRFADSLFVTEVHTSIEDADTFFPGIDAAAWKEVSRSEMHTDPKTGFTFEFVVYGRQQAL